MNRKWRLYLDTSVFGGCFDAAQGWAEDSRRVVDAARKGIVKICFSATVARELEGAFEVGSENGEVGIGNSSTFTLRISSFTLHSSHFMFLTIVSPKEVQFDE